MLKRIALSLLCTLFMGLLSACNPSGVLRSEDSNSPLKTEASKGAENTTETSGNPAENTKNSAPEVGVRDGISAPVAIPPSFDGQQPLEPGQNGTAYMPNGMPALQPMKGINADELFSENIKDSDERFNRVENAVVDIRKEFDSLKPSIIRLAAVESDIQNLIKELEVMLQETPNPQQQQPVDLMAGGAESGLDGTGEQANLQIHQLEPQPPPPPSELPVPQVLTPPAQEPQAATPQIAETGNADVPVPGSAATASPPPQQTPVPATQQQPVPQAAAAPEAVSPPPKTKPVSTPVYEAQKPAEKRPAAAPAKQYDGTVATNLRLGEHGNKVRVVFDTNATLAFTIDYDEGENLIVVEIPDAKWVGEKQKSFADSGLIDSYSVSESNGGKGSTIAITLKKPSKILKQDSLEPDDNPNHRIYFDLAL